MNIKSLSKEQILALKITWVLFCVFVFLILLLIYIYHIDWFFKQKSEFNNLITITQKMPRFPEWLIEEINDRPRWFINFWIRRQWNFWIRDFFIINENWKIFSRWIFDEIDFDKNFKFNLNEIIQKKIWEKEIFIYWLNKWKYTIFLAKDVSNFKSAEKRLILIAWLLSILILIIIYFISLKLAKITIKPIEDANKILTEFNHNVAHELKTPIAILKTNIELEEMKWKLKNFMKSSKEELNNMESIINWLLFLSENNNLNEIENIDLKYLINSIFEKLKFLYKKNKISFIINWELIIKWNKFLLNSLFKNLIENAYKYANIKSQIIVNINNKFIEIINEWENISKEKVTHIFDPFYQIDKSRNSYWFWLWLSISKKITELHGWHIIFESKNKKNKVSVIF